MKPITLCILSCLFLVSIQSCNSSNKKLESYDDFPLEFTDEYKKVWSEEFSNNMGTFYFYELKEPKIFRTYPIEGQFRVNPEGKLCSFTLSKTHEINGTLIPKGSSYSRYEDDFYFISLSKDTSIQGFPVYHKEDGFIFWSENNVDFYNDGTIKSFGLSEDLVIKGISCNASKNSRRVILFQNGELRHCHLSKNTEIQGSPCHGGDENSQLWFKHNGQMLSFVLSEDYTIDGKLYSQGTQIIFNKNSKVHYLSGHLKFLSFYNNDMIHNVVLKDDLEVQGSLFSKGSRLVYNETGELNSAKPKQDIVIEGIPCKKKEWVGFYPDGKLSWCKLSDDIEAEGNVYKKGTWLNFDEDGKAFIQ